MRRPLVVAALAVGTAAHAQSPRVDLSDVLKRHFYAAAFNAITHGQAGLPAWMRTAAAAQETTTSPGRIVTVDGRRVEVYEACKPHDCGDNELVVMFTPVTGSPAKALLADSHGRRFMGSVSSAEQQALIGGLDALSSGL